MGETGYQLLGAAIVGAFSGLFWLAARAVPLWLCRRFAPTWEWALTAPLSQVIAHLGRTALKVRR